MSSRPLLGPFQVITNGDMSAASLTSTVSIIQNTTRVAYSLSWAGTAPIGAVTVQVSNDYTQNGAGSVANAGTWTTISFTLNGTTVSSLPVSGNSGTGFINITDIAAYAIRLVYTKTSGTGTLQAIITGKVS